MLYRHKITGAVIDVESTMSGDWQALRPASAHAASKTAEKTQARKAPEKAVGKNGRTVRNKK